MHNLATNAAGNAAFISLRELPWHKLGTVVDTEMPGREFLAAAGLDYEVRTCELVANTLTNLRQEATGWDAKTDTPIYATVGDIAPKVHPQQGVYRMDTGAVLPAAVGTGFEVFQNTEIIDFFEGLVKDHKIVYECAGALGVGEEVWVLAHIPTLNMAINGDDHRSYMLIRNGHCGNVTLQCFPTNIRVVCANTMAMAESARRREGEFGTAKTGYTIRHTRNMRDIVSQVQQAYARVVSDFEDQREVYEFLAGKPVDEKAKQAFFTWFALNGRDPKRVQAAMETPEDERTRGDRTILTRFTAEVDDLERLFESETNQQPGTRNTMYACLQTAIEYIDHERSTRCGENDDCDAKRFESAMFGSGQRVKVQALKAAIQLAETVAV